MLKLDKILGKGSYGVVYKGTYDDIPIALKRNFKDQSFGEIGVNILKEFDALNRLKHDKYIVDLIDIIYYNFNEETTTLTKITKNKTDCDEKIHFILELCDSNLHEYVCKEGENFRKIESLKYFMKNILLSLVWIHNKGIIHRDLKPQNILVKKNENGEILFKLCDFGMCLQNFGEITNTFGITTSYFRAPEICKKLPYDEKIDLWAFGSILFEVFSGKNLLHNVEDECEKILELFHKKLPSQINYTEKNLTETIANLRRLCNMTKAQVTKYNNQDPNFLNTFFEIMAKLLISDPDLRPTAEEVLTQYEDFFDNKVEDNITSFKNQGLNDIENNKKNYLEYSEEIKSLLSSNLNIREVRRKAFTVFEAIFKTKTFNEWYSNRIFFHSISLFDLYLLTFFKSDSLKNFKPLNNNLKNFKKIDLKSLFDSEEHSKISKNSFTHEEIFLRVYAILYTSTKFHEVFKIFDWKSFAPKNHYFHTKENKKFVEYFEIFLFKEVKEDSFHILNEYESLFFDKNIKPSEKIISYIFESTKKISDKI